MTPDVLAELVRAAASDVLTRRGLDLTALPADVTVERPRNPEHGDYATNVAMRTAKKAGVVPRDLALVAFGTAPKLDSLTSTPASELFATLAELTALGAIWGFG